MDLEHMSWRMFFIRTVEIVFVINIAILDIFAIENLSKYKAPIFTLQTKQVVPMSTPSTPTPTQIPSLTPFQTPTPVIQTIINQTTQGNIAKEIFIPLGTGQSLASDWTNVDGTQVSVNSSNYPNIKQVVFEAAISVPTANEVVYIRLFNITDGHPVWFSDMNMSGASQFLTSAPITLNNGNKTYQVQMKTQLQYPANLTQARIHITLQ